VPFSPQAARRKFAVNASLTVHHEKAAVSDRLCRHRAERPPASDAMTV
jgi:hypothetical protein